MKRIEFYKAFLLFQSFFLIILVFATLRPLQSSLVIKELGSAFFPYIWVLTAIFIGFVVLLFNKLADFFSRTTLLGFSILSTALVFLLMRWGLGSKHQMVAQVSTVLLNIWSDAFVVVMIEQFWAFANDFFKTSAAKKLYGLMDTGSVLGGVVGSLSVRFFVERVGSFNILYFCVGYLLLLFIPIFLIRRFLDQNPHLSYEAPEKKKSSARGDSLAGFKLLAKQPYLRLIMIVVLLSQVITNLVEYHFHHSVEQLRQSLDLQTTFLGDVHFYINFGSFLANALLVGPCLTFLGVRRTMLVLPLVNGVFSILQFVGTGLGSALIFPPSLLLRLNLFSRVADKSLGYSLFRSSKEVLYIPLAPETKFRAKTVIDMFVYRFGKLVGSLLIIPVVKILGINFLQATIFLLVILLCYYIFRVTRAYGDRVTRV